MQPPEETVRWSPPMVGWGRLDVSTTMSQALLGWLSSFPSISGVSYSLNKTSPDHARKRRLLHKMLFLTLLGMHTDMQELAWGQMRGAGSGGGVAISSKYSQRCWDGLRPWESTAFLGRAASELEK